MSVPELTPAQQRMLFAIGRQASEADPSFHWGDVDTELFSGDRPAAMRAGRSTRRSSMNHGLEQHARWRVATALVIAGVITGEYGDDLGTLTPVGFEALRHYRARWLARDTKGREVVAVARARRST